LSDFEMLSRAASGLNQAERQALSTAHAQRVNRVKAATRGLAAEDAEGMSVLIGGIAACEAALKTLGDAAAAAGNFGDAAGLSMSELEEVLALGRKTLEAAVGATGGDMPEAGDTPLAIDPAVTSVSAGSQSAAPSAPGTINSRADVETSLDRIVAFYERTEPGSPIPHLARRMRRMVAMDFLELMEEIAPSGLKEFRNAAGVDDAKKK
jgi:type VI secretion system protein ImpA